MGDGGVACVASSLRLETFRSNEDKKVVIMKSKMKFASSNSSRRDRFNSYDSNNNDNYSSEDNDNENYIDEDDDFAANGNGNWHSNINNKDEVEEGELGTWDMEEEEYVSEKASSHRRYEIRSEVEKGEFYTDRWRKGDVEKGEFVPGKWRKGEYSSGNNRRRDYDGSEYGGGKDEVEKGEFIPDRWQQGNQYNASKKKAARRKPEHGRTPSASKYFGEKETGHRNGNQGYVTSSKKAARWESNNNNSRERPVRAVSKIVDEDGNEFSNGKTHGREFPLGNRLKRNNVHTDNSDRKYHGEFNDYTPYKSRRLSDDGSRVTYTTDHSYKNSANVRSIASERYSSRNCESPLSSRPAYDRYNSSPRPSERSPHDRPRQNEYRDHDHRSPVRRDRSPYGRNRHYDYRNRSPSYSERSPHEQARGYDRRERTPSLTESSPHNRGRSNNYREGNRKTGSSEKRKSHYESRSQEEKVNPSGKETQILAKESEIRVASDTCDGSVEKSSYREDLKHVQEVNGAAAANEELLSMEEDMDICDTPPHASEAETSVSTSGKWFYLDHLGVEQGPSRLCDLKILVEEGFLVSDHLIKHLDSQRWVTVENAVSPLVTANFPCSFVDGVTTELASPPEAPGNLLVEAGEFLPTNKAVELDISSETGHDIESQEDLRIDERVKSLFDGFPSIPGRELETVAEVLKMTFAHGELQRGEYPEGGTFYQSVVGDHDCLKMIDDISCHPEFPWNEVSDIRPTGSAPSDKDYSYESEDLGDWFSSQLSCKGGDWKRIGEAAQDGFVKKKFVLNDGYALCQMPKSGHEDPRRHQKDELYHSSHGRRLDLPYWGFNPSDESTDYRSSQTKYFGLRGVKGMMLPVIRINTCVVKDHGSFVSEPRTKSRGKERYSTKPSHRYGSASDSKRSSEESVSRRKSTNEHGHQHVSSKSIMPVSMPKDHLSTKDDLQLHLGEWFYLDGAGHERGPLSSSEIQVLADQGIIQKHSSVFRKFDKLWVPVTSISDGTKLIDNENSSGASGASGLETTAVVHSGTHASSSLFNSLHPQFIGYTRGKLHELIMKSYKSREFAAAINEVLDPWINLRQPRKEIEKNMYNSVFTSKFTSSDQANKRAWIMDDGVNGDYTLDDASALEKHEVPFEDLCSDATFFKDKSMGSVTENENWGQLDGQVLARVFHFLRTDLKSLVYANSTCKHWRSVVAFYKDISRQADLSSVTNCTDSIIRNIMNGYNKEKVTSLILRGCTEITSNMLEEILRLLPCISSVDIRGCSQFEDLARIFPNIIWVKTRTLQSTIRNHQLTDRRTYDSHVEDSSGLRDYFESLDKRDASNQLFRRSLYKRSKVFDARKSSSMLSRDAQLRRLAMKNSENGYKRMKDFLALGLKDIMKENTFEFFIPKVAEIESKIRSGYYAGRGLGSVKDDIRRMCREAIKVKNKGDARDMNRIINLFIRLATSLEDRSKFSIEKDAMMKNWKDDSPPGFSSASSKSKKVNRERKYTGRSSGSFINGGTEPGYYASDREIKRRLSKLNRKAMDSGSDTSDDRSRSSEETETDSESSSSGTNSDFETRSESGPGDLRMDGCVSPDDGFDSWTDDREWGARMTKASLVPPVTRKYEVIDHYVIVTDHESVQRKMQVTLPEDYSEKLIAQKNGNEESDMDFPEVKHYKPRKQLGDEVIEQEVYGIDPYTHNLLLDSMPEESDWHLLDKHVFIEDVLLRTLNKQVRSFTGTGNTPMKYPLKQVLEDILKNAKEDQDTRTSELCQYMLKAMSSRPDDNYVAYRKGLGVVCNKEAGFSEDDFVVEFLGEVYPAWRWFEKQDGIRALQKDSKEPAPEFYNIYLERPKGDGDGYDLVVVDAMHKANYASRICHSCRPNCEAKVTAVDGQYQIGIYSVRPIVYGEEVTFDYNSVTESKEEYEASVCLCGSQVCRGSFLNLTGEGAFQKVLKESHGILNRHQMMLEACELNSVSEEDYIELSKAGLGSCLLSGLPDWLIAYSARVVRFIHFERTKLPEVILTHNLEEKKKYFTDICMDTERNEAEIQAEGVFNQRIQNLALTLDKVRYVMKNIFGDPKRAPPLLEKLTPKEVASYLWKGEGSVVDELIQCITPHLEDGHLDELRSSIRAHDPSSSDDTQVALRKSLLWLRDEVRNLQCSLKCRHDAAADLIHIYAHTKHFFRVKEYKTIVSPPVYISPLDLGPKSAEKLGPGLHEYRKTYAKNYCLGQLIFWHNQAYAEPDFNLIRAGRGCLSLPEVGSFYTKSPKPSPQRVYGPRTVKSMLSRMEKQPQKAWPKDKIWSFKSCPNVFGSPMLDSLLNNTPLDKDLVHWLKQRPPIFQAMWDR
uniref:histone-lysine N-methyltransferase ATXR3 n=1 Tax=Erigeron canadensis TaxID=72917 RepID=UPI001CB8E0A2|nr:histone-lysine N-methyltransferase ATXR3 [Erigeron canadensis]XP_043614146.1 histone-lysine N-methyltransferase ATXR3 [Erigeron canadensis]